MPLTGNALTTALAAGLALTLLLLGVLGWACYRLLVDRGRVLLRMPQAGEDARRVPRGLPSGAFLHDFALPASGGGTLTLSGLLGHRLLLIFVRPDCLFSRAFARELAGREPVSTAPRPVVIVSGDVEDPQALAAYEGLPGVVLFDRNGAVARLMRVGVTPAGYLVDATRRTIGRLRTGPEALLAAATGNLEAGSTEAPLAVSPLPRSTAVLKPLVAGDKAPDFTLPLATGGDWSLRDMRGAPLTLVFADPACPPCAPLLPELRRRRNPGLVVVSRGDAAETRRLAEDMGDTTPVVLQRSREVARAFGTLETPAAYRIDAAGIIAAGPEIGAEAVLACIDGGREERHARAAIGEPPR